MANQWWEIKIFAEPNLEDLIFWRLETFGCRGTATEQRDSQCTTSAYLPQEKARSLDLAALSLWLRQDALSVNLPPPLMQWIPIDEEDWASSWKQYWHPLEVGDRFLIYPAWLDPPESNDRLLLRLDPGAAFGTGSHPSTQLCMESLEMRVSPESEVVIADIGCGSGILSVAALLLGAKQVYAMDVDPLAVRSTTSNGEMNHVSSEQLVVEKGSIDRAIEMNIGPVDGILCNIIAETIVELVPQFEAISKPSTWGIISGVLMDQAKFIADTLEQQDWVVATLWRRKEWCCFNIRRS